MTIKNIADLTPDRENARSHNPRNVGMIVDALHEVGAARSIVIDEDGLILAGNATIEAAAMAGIEQVQVVDVDGETVVAVRRSGLTAEQKKRLAYFDNRTAELADWDADQLLADLQGGLDLSGLFGKDELDELLKGLVQEPPDDKGPQIDKAAELQEKWGIKLGDMWEIPSHTMLGKCHRVMCGDSTNEKNVSGLMQEQRASLVFEDPPYGIGYDSHHADRWGRPNPHKAILGDKQPEATKLIEGLSGLILPGAPVFICSRWNVLHEWQLALELEGLIVKNCIAWVKSDHGMGDLTGAYGSKWEAVLFAHDGTFAFPYKRPVDVWDLGQIFTGGFRGHPTRKTVKLPVHAIKTTGVSGLILDRFLGSGTTLVACEQTGRIGHGMEIEPKYVAVTLERLAELGLEPQLITS